MRCPWLSGVRKRLCTAVQCTKSGAYSYLQKPCELDRRLEVLTEAYQKRIMNKMQIQQDRMEEILKPAGASSPLGILRRLKELETGGR